MNVFRPVLEERIKEIAEKKGVSLLWLSEKIGMTKQGFYYMLSHKTIKVEILEKIAKVLDVPITNFFLYEEEAIVSEEKKKSEGTDPLLQVLIIVGAIWHIYSLAKKKRDIIERAKNDDNYTKSDMIDNLVEDLKELGEITDAMNEFLEKNRFSFPKPNQ